MMQPGMVLMTGSAALTEPLLSSQLGALPVQARSKQDMILGLGFSLLTVDTAVTPISRYNLAAGQPLVAGMPLH
jgi:hypothetical protein